MYLKGTLHPYEYPFKIEKPTKSYINQNTQKKKNIRNKKEGLTSKKMKKPPKKANHKRTSNSQAPSDSKKHIK
jgi:hypothetical protein